MIKINWKDIKLIATVILNYLIFKNEKFKKMTEDNNLIYILSQILNIIYYNDDPKKLYELLELEEITFIYNTFGGI